MQSKYLKSQAVYGLFRHALDGGFELKRDHILKRSTQNKQIVLEIKLLFMQGFPNRRRILFTFGSLIHIYYNKYVVLQKFNKQFYRLLGTHKIVLYDRYMFFGVWILQRFIRMLLVEYHNFYVRFLIAKYSLQYS